MDTRMKIYKTVAVFTFLYASETVSYTHLDVYKRQGLYNLTLEEEKKKKNLLQVGLYLVTLRKSYVSESKENAS